jgi:hypothetical protein
MIQATTERNAAGLLPPLRAEPIMMRLGLAMVLSLALTVPALLLDDRTFQQENVWVKPIKFQIALGIYFVTLSVFAGWLPRKVTGSSRMKKFLAVVVIASIAEMIWIAGAAMFATASHYNTAPLMQLAYGAMGVAAVILTSASLILGLAFWRDKRSALPDPFRLSLALGLILTFALTLPAAGTLSSMPGHFIGVPETGAVLPLMGWSREVGDLRVAHFLATHALHAVPVAGLVAMMVPGRAIAIRLVWAAATTYAALTAATFVQALMGQPFL